MSGLVTSFEVREPNSLVCLLSWPWSLMLSVFLIDQVRVWQYGALRRRLPASATKFLDYDGRRSGGIKRPDREARSHAPAGAQPVMNGVAYDCCGLAHSVSRQGWGPIPAKHDSREWDDVDCVSCDICTDPEISQFYVTDETAISPATSLRSEEFCSH